MLMTTVDDGWIKDHGGDLEEDLKLRANIWGQGAP